MNPMTLLAAAMLSLLSLFSGSGATETITQVTPSTVYVQLDHIKPGGFFAGGYNLTGDINDTLTTTDNDGDGLADEIHVDGETYEWKDGKYRITTGMVEKYYEFRRKKPSGYTYKKVSKGIGVTYTWTGCCDRDN